MSLAYKAMMLAFNLHKDQKRKYTGNPYTDHLAEVAGIVATVLPGDVKIATAWLHDAMEDQGLSELHLYQHFGAAVAYGVKMLSDLEVGNRATRKQLSRERLAKAPGWIQTIKCADLISNTSSIMMHDPEFAKVYLEEKRLLLDVMVDADPRLRRLAYNLL